MSAEATSQRTAWTPWLVLLLGAVATAMGAGFVQRSIAERDLARFEQVVRAAEDRLVTRVEVHLAILRATAGLFNAGLNPSREQFARYVARIRLSQFYPGVQGVGFSYRVRAGELDAFLAERERRGLPELRVWPMSPREEYHVVALLEPLEWRNRVALGFDMSTEAVRRAAMERARDSGRAAMSGKVKLVQETDEDQQPGFLIYVPVYAQGDAPATVAARQEALLGYAYSPLRARDFFEAVFEGAPPLIGLDIYDGDEIDEEARLFATAGRRSGSFSFERTMMVANRPWTIRYTSLPGFDAQSNRSLPAIFAAVGVVVSLLFFLLVRLEVRTRRANETAAILRERLLAIVGHDLRNPLSAITMGTAALARKQGLDPSVDALIRRIDRSAQRMARLIAQLLDFARIQQGMALAVERVPTKVDEVVRQVVEECQLANPEAEVRLELEGPAPAEADPDRLAEVVSNLVGNALQHGQGPITVRVRERGPERLTIEVHSRGPAIAHDVVPQLFDPYARGSEKGPCRTGGGLGLGLYIAREIVHGHGGRIEVRSSAQEGNTFTVVLPRRREGEAGAQRGEP